MGSRKQKPAVRLQEQRAKQTNRHLLVCQFHLLAPAYSLSPPPPPSPEDLEGGVNKVWGSSNAIVSSRGRVWKVLLRWAQGTKGGV